MDNGIAVWSQDEQVGTNAYAALRYKVHFPSTYKNTADWHCKSSPVTAHCLLFGSPFC